MAIEEQDHTILTILRSTRQRIGDLRLTAMSSRMRDVAVECLQGAMVRLDTAIMREDMEEVEAEETLLEFRQSREQAISVLSQLLDLLKRALYSPGADFPEMRDHRTSLRSFLDEHDAQSFTMETTASLAEDADQMAAFLPIFIPILDGRMDVTRTIETLQNVITTLLDNQRNFAREESEYVQAQGELEEARQVAYITMLNVRDIMRAALREENSLEQLDEIVPTLAESLR